MRGLNRIIGFAIALAAMANFAAQTALSQPVDSFTTTSTWQYFPKYALHAKEPGFGKIELYDTSTEALVGAVNFVCRTTASPYLDLFAYKTERNLALDDQERRWPTITDQTILRFENYVIPVSIERGFIFIDITPQKEHAVRKMLDVAGDQIVDRKFEIPGFAKIAVTFVPVSLGPKAQDEAHVSFNEMLNMCKANKTSKTSHVIEGTAVQK